MTENIKEYYRKEIDKLKDRAERECPDNPILIETLWILWSILDDLTLEEKW